MSSYLPSRTIKVIDSHTGGEPTRVVVEGGPDLGRGSMADRRRIFCDRFDEFRSAVVGEPRGYESLVGVLLCPPSDSTCAAGVIFFNNVGTIGMCGHGSIGLGVTLGHLGRIGPGRHRLESPVGIATIEFDGENTVAVENVPSYRSGKGVTIEVDGFGPLTGDVAWGGNWFFVSEEHRQNLSMSNVSPLTDFSWRVRRALERDGVSGDDGHLIDHIALVGPPSRPDADAKNFVLCPGGAYDRSPCGTGTSAVLACLVADGKLRDGQIWRQEGITGSVFEAWARAADNIAGGRIVPTIRGSAFITAESTLVCNSNDPLRTGIRI